MWATIIGAGGSMAVIALLVWQNVLTRKVANAAQTSADTIKNIERPWILISETSMEVEHVKAPEGKWDNRTSVVWKFKNFGKTPAFIVDISGGIKILPSLDTAYAPIYEPPYSGPNDPVIAPAEESGYIIFIIPTTMVVREQMDITVDKLFLIFSGRITYKDTFGDGSMHESKFCLRYCNRPRGFHLMFGRQEYNEYT